MANIVSPLPGVFYRRPGPGKDPFTTEGDRVEVGQTIGLVEIMKQFSEIKADVSGTLSSLPIEDGGLVQPGDILAVIDEH